MKSYVQQFLESIDGKNRLMSFMLKHCDVLKFDQAYNPSYINMSKIDIYIKSSLRPVLLDPSIEGDCFQIKWRSRGWEAYPENREYLYKEIRRWARYIRKWFKEINPDEDCSMPIKIRVQLSAECNPEHLNDTKEFTI